MDLGLITDPCFGIQMLKAESCWASHRDDVAPDRVVELASVADEPLELLIQQTLKFLGPVYQ